MLGLASMSGRANPLAELVDFSKEGKEATEKMSERILCWRSLRTSSRSLRPEFAGSCVATLSFCGLV